MTQNHIIKKQVLDITLDSEIGSFALQNRVGEIFKSEIIPAIDAYCTGISDDFETVRIDKLEIHLGTIHRNTLAKDFKHKIAELFPGKLAEALERNRNPYIFDLSGDDFDSGNAVTREIRDIELLEYFIKNGRLPWWVKGSEAFDIPALLETYVTQQPARIKNLIAGLINNPGLVKRLVYYADGLVLEKIIALFQGRYQELCKLTGELIAAFVSCSLLGSYDQLKIGMEVWASILILAAQEKPLNRKQVIQNAAGKIAVISGVDYTALYRYIVKDIETKGYDMDDPFISPGSSDITIKKYVQRLENIVNRLRELQVGLMNRKVTAGSTPIAPSILDQLMNQISGIVKAVQNTGEKEIIQQAKELEVDIEKLHHDLEVVLQENRLEAEPDLVKKITDSMESMTESGEGLTKTDVFSGSEEIYVHNAGLVLLWPYLARFFENLGLLANYQFVNEAANERAIQLLHYLGSSNGEAPEYELMLNKILCGIDPEAPIQPFFTINETEIVECESLLQSVIKLWPVLKNVTIAGLRSMFLKREGIISIRDGHWLLRIEEQAHDVLLDKMPWGINTVKLPWMPELLFVEWRL
jgi:hypothetical protein